MFLHSILVRPCGVNKYYSILKIPSFLSEARGEKKLNYLEHFLQSRVKKRKEEIGNVLRKKREILSYSNYSSKFVGKEAT